MLQIELGQMIKPGDRIATIDDGIGRQIVKVTARTAGMAIGVLRTAAVHKGDALVHVAEVGP